MADDTVTIQISGSFKDGSGDSATYSGTLNVDYTTNSVNGNFDIEGTNGNGFGASGDFSRIINQNGNQYVVSGQQLTVTYTGQEPDTARIQFTHGDDVYDTNGQAPVDSNPCFCRGTLIRTVRGDVPVESLAIGELVVTASGEHRAIRWIGHRAYAGRFANANPDVLPIRVKAGALAEGVPARDLWVSPKHALYLDGVLIPAEALVNGTSIVKAERVDEVTYFHVELESHDVIIAEGAPAESFVDDCGRGVFLNAPTFRALYPDAVDVEAVYCAPRVDWGLAVAKVRRRIADRAGPPQTPASAAA